MPIIVENNAKNYKKNRNNIFSYWPYLAPESCINFRRNFMLRFLKKNKYLNSQIYKCLAGFQMGVYAFFIENTLLTLKKTLLITKVMGSPKNILNLVIAGLLEEKIRLTIFLKYQNININININ